MVNRHTCRGYFRNQPLELHHYEHNVINMADILFIANDQSVQLLIGDLQPLIEERIYLETDYTSGIKRIFDTHPAVVFLQQKIGEVTCDKLVNQVKMLLDGESVPLILLSDEAAMSYSVASNFEACFMLCLPPDELNRQVKQLLQTLPKIIWKADVTDFCLTFGLHDDPAGSTCGSTQAPLDCCPLEGLEDNSQALLDLANAREPETPLSAPEAPAGRFALEPLHSLLEKACQQEKSARPAPAKSHVAQAQEKPYTGASTAWKLDPTQPFQSMSESSFEPSFDPVAPVEPRTASKGASTALGRIETSGIQAADPAVQPVGAAQHPKGPATDTGISAPLAGEDPADPMVRLGIIEDHTPLYRRLSTCLISALCLVLGVIFLDLYFALTPVAGILQMLPGSADPGTRWKPARLASPPPAAPQLPAFIPKVAPDPSYTSRHPCWECYRADALEFLVFRENGAVRAVQVISEARGAITLPLLNTCVRASTGYEQAGIKKKETRDGFEVTTGALQNGGEVVIYKEIPGSEIRGFVLTFPAGKPT
jgi:hypothetical protein